VTRIGLALIEEEVAGRVEHALVRNN